MKIPRARVLEIGALVAAFSVCGAHDAWAYIDPGSGSYALQLLMAGIVAGIYTVRRYWASVKETVAKPFQRRSKPTTSEPPEPR